MASNVPPERETDWTTLVLGIGNLLWADEGFGVRCVEHLNAGYEFPESVRVMDGGTQGIFLLPWVRSARRLLLFDAIDFGLPPATLTNGTGLTTERIDALVPPRGVAVRYYDAAAAADFGPHRHKSVV